MAELERKYVVPLRREFVKISTYRRTPRAMRVLREFIMKHMKVDDVKILKELNEYMHKHGRKNPPHKVEIKVKRVEEKDHVYAVANIPSGSLDIKKKTEVKQSLTDRIKSAAGVKTAPKKEDSAEKKEKKDVLEHAEHHEVEDKTPNAPEKSKTPRSPKAGKVIPSGKKDVKK